MVVDWSFVRGELPDFLYKELKEVKRVMMLFADCPDFNGNICSGDGGKLFIFGDNEWQRFVISFKGLGNGSPYVHVDDYCGNNLSRIGVDVLRTINSKNDLHDYVNNSFCVD